MQITPADSDAICARLGLSPLLGSYTETVIVKYEGRSHTRTVTLR